MTRISKRKPGPSRRRRKIDYVSTLATKGADVKLVSAADELHDASRILADDRTVGDALWERFAATREQTHWCYRAVTRGLERSWDHPLLRRLRATVETLHTETGVPWRPEPDPAPETP